MDIVGKAKEDVSLPKATMTKIIKEMLPAHVRITRDAQDLLVECCVEFINLISSESNEICYKEDKRTISPEHVLESLKVLGFGNYVREVHAAYEQHRIESWVFTFNLQCKRSLEPLLTQFYLEKDCPKTGTKWGKEQEMTEEEALLEQQRMFAEARARMNSGNTVPRQSQSE